MRVVCAWCQHESRSGFLREVAPLDDATETHGICEAHHTEVVRQLLASAGMITDPAAGAGRAPVTADVLSALLRLSAWVHATPAIVAAALARIVEEIGRLDARCRALEAEGAHVSREIAWLRDEVARLRTEHDELTSWHREATWVASTLLDQVLEQTLQPLHGVVGRLRSVPRPAARGRAAWAPSRRSGSRPAEGPESTSPSN
jgi:hypothetical protein